MLSRNARLLAFVAGMLALVFVAACGGGDEDADGDAAELDLPPPGEYAFDVSGTVEIEAEEPQASAGPLRLQGPIRPGPQNVDVEGGLRIDLRDDGTFTISGADGLNLEGALQDGVLTVVQNPDQGSSGSVESSEDAAVTSYVDAYLQLGTPTAQCTTGDQPVRLEGGDLFLGGGATLETPGSMDPVPCMTEDGIIVYKVLTVNWGLQEADTADEEEPTPTELPQTELEPGLAAFLGLLGVGAKDYDQIFFETDPTGDHIFGDPNVEPGFTPPYTDMTGYFSTYLSVSEDVAAALDSTLGCGASFGDNQVLCAEGAGAFPSGNVYVFGGIYGDAVPVDPDRLCTYAVVVDTGWPWQTQGPYTFDFYQGAGGWHQVTGGGGVPWGVAITAIDEQQQALPVSGNSRALIIRDLNVVAFALAGDQVLAAQGWRVTADCNLNFLPAESGGDVPGADPTQGLLPFPPLVQPAEPICDTSAFATCP